MKLDVYICHDYFHEFAVKDGQEVQCCPACGTQDFEFSHEVDLLEQK